MVVSGSITFFRSDGATATYTGQLPRLYFLRVVKKDHALASFPATIRVNRAPGRGQRGRHSPSSPLRLFLTSCTATRSNHEITSASSA